MLQSLDDSRLEARHLRRAEGSVDRRLSVMDQFSNVCVDEDVDVSATYQIGVEHAVDVPDSDALWTGHGLAALVTWIQTLVGARLRQCSEPVSSHRRRNVLKTAARL